MAILTPQSSFRGTMKNDDWGHEAAIAEAVHKGSREAEARLAERLRPGLLLMLRRRLRDAARAEDLTQEVLVALIRNLREGRLREPQRLVSYAWGIAANLARQERHSPAGESISEETLADLPHPAPGPEALLLEAERWAQVRRALASLLPRDREILRGFYWGGREKAELCERFELTSAQFDVVKSRALGRLAQACAEGAEEGERKEALRSLPDKASS